MQQSKGKHMNDIERVITDLNDQWRAGFRAGVEKNAGEHMYHALGRACIARILRADVLCEPPLDVLLRLECIISERDHLRSLLNESGAAEKEKT